MANEEMSAPAMLEAAARLVTRALGKLDTTEEPRCKECGLRRFANKEEARVHENLSPLPSRLRHAAAKLQGSDQPAIPPEEPDVPEWKREMRERQRDRNDVQSVIKSESKKRAAPWEGRGKND